MATTTNPLLQQIDAIAKEKGVEPDIIISAVQDALEAAARKRYKSEALRARLNPETGQFDLYAVKTIVAEVTDQSTQISLDEARGVSATKPKSTWRSNSRGRPRISDASPRRPPSR